MPRTLVGIANLPSIHVPYRVKTMVVSPAQALKWMANALRNRRLVQHRVDEYALSMHAGHWQLNGEALLFDEEDRLMDGRHRCAAAIQADVSFNSLCIFGLPHGVIPTLDTGKTRSAGDVLEIIRGETNARMLAASLNWLWLYETKQLGVNMSRKSIPRDSLLESLDKNGALRGSLPWGWRAKRLLSPGMGAAMHYLMAQKDRDLAEKFFGTLVLGEGLKQTEGMYLLRERLHKDWGAKMKMQAAYKSALTIQVWNSWRAGKFQQARLRLPTESLESQTFPIIQ